MERNEAPALWREPPVHRYSPFLPLPRQRPTLQIENVMGYLPEHLKEQVKAAMRAAFRLPAEEGIAWLEKRAQWLEREYPGAAASLREGLPEMFTVNRLGLSPALSRCLCSTNRAALGGRRLPDHRKEFS